MTFSLLRQFADYSLIYSFHILFHLQTICFYSFIVLASFEYKYSKFFCYFGAFRLSTSELRSSRWTQCTTAHDAIWFRNLLCAVWLRCIRQMRMQMAQFICSRSSSEHRKHSNIELFCISSWSHFTSFHLICAYFFSILSTQVK